jgi:hypothetical protein
MERRTVLHAMLTTAKLRSPGKGGEGRMQPRTPQI